MILDDPNHVTSIGERVTLYCSSFVASFLLCGVMPIMVFQSWFVIPFSVAVIFFTVPRLYAFLFDRLAASRGSKGESQA